LPELMIVLAVITNHCRKQPSKSIQNRD